MVELDGDGDDCGGGGCCVGSLLMISFRCSIEAEFHAFRTGQIMKTKRRQQNRSSTTRPNTTLRRQIPHHKFNINIHTIKKNIFSYGLVV